MSLSKELQKGKAGEYLVCADLILKGFVAYPSEQGLPYDVVLDNGKKLIKVQVKTTEGYRIVPQRSKVTQCYVFNIKRHGKNNLSRYEYKDVDVFALVCLNTRKIGYLTHGQMPSTVNFRCGLLRGTYYDEQGIALHEKVLALKGTMKQSEIAKTLGTDDTTVSRMIKPEYKPFKTNARYFEDIERETDWFFKL